MVNGDPTTFLFRVDLKVVFPNPQKSGYLFRDVFIGASNYEQAKQNAVNCYKRWYPECEITAI